MRGTDTKQGTMLSLVTPEQRVPQSHPLRAVKRLADAALVELSPTFSAMYSAVGRPSIPPERLLKASLLMALYTVRSERLFCEQLDYNLLFRWFLNMNMDEESFVPTVFTKNRQRLIEHDVREPVFRRSRRPSPLCRADERRPFYRRWHAHRGVGLAQEFQAQGREGRRQAASGRPGKSFRRLPWREAEQRHARVEDRS